MELLPTINSPQDLRRLELDQLPQLAAEIRQVIINTVSENGGHLGANLGVVELTLALHYAFDTPDDKLLWDVGHQCYAHKLITGRQARFSTLRQQDGVSGFCNREESPYDLYTTGHSSDSISLALGLAAARDLAGDSYQVATVIGDGALTGGMALEALDHAGDLAKPLIVVLNDNEMSIAGNVGAISAHLSRIRANQGYERAKKKVRGALSRLPWLGGRLTRLISKFKTSLKSALVPGMIFENMGFVYLGPINGHDIPALVALMRQAQQIAKPVLLHVRTVKGKGYPPAELQPEYWHGAEPFHINSGQLKNGKSESYTAVFSQAACRLAAEDQRIVAITAAMAEGTGLSSIRDRFPERFFDTAIAEQHAAGFAAGLALAGQRPLLAVYSTFLQRAYDQVIEDICLQKLPVVLAVDRAGVVGGDGCSHQGIFDLTYLRALPGLTLMAPADGRELEEMLRFAFSLKAPAAIRYPRAAAVRHQGDFQPLVLGRSVTVRDGHDLALVAIGAMVEPARQAAEILAAQGIEARVINARFVTPLDQDCLLQAAAQCQGRLLTLEDNVSQGGFGQACAAAVAHLPGTEVEIAALPCAFLSHGSRQQILSQQGLDAAGIVRRVRERWFSA